MGQLRTSPGITTVLGEDHRVGGEPDHPGVPRRGRGDYRDAAVGGREPARGNVAEYAGKPPVNRLVVHPPIICDRQPTGLPGALVPFRGMNRVLAVV